MKANELRIGNYINRRYKENILVVDFELLQNVQRQSVFFKPIPLTEQQMVNLGAIEFNLDKDEFYCQIGLFTFKKIGNGFILLDDNNINEFFGSTILEYVHQIQNLYFALTKKELKYK